MLIVYHLHLKDVIKEYKLIKLVESWWLINLWGNGRFFMRLIRLRGRLRMMCVISVGWRHRVGYIMRIYRRLSLKCWNADTVTTKHALIKTTTNAKYAITKHTETHARHRKRTKTKTNWAYYLKNRTITIVDKKRR